MPPEVETHLVNAVLTNGARYYVDHAHPEYSTPECADAARVRAATTRRASGSSPGRWRRRAGCCPPGQEIVVYKNNSDGKGNSLRLPRELPHGPGRAVRPHRAARHAALRHPPDLHRRGQGRHARRRRPRPDVAVPAHPAGRLLRGGGRARDHAEAADRQHPRRAARRRAEVPAPARDRRRRQPVPRSHLPEGRHHRDRAGDDRGRLVRRRATSRLAAPVQAMRAGVATTSTLRHAARAGRRLDGDGARDAVGAAATWPASTPRSAASSASAARRSATRSCDRWEEVLTRPRDRSRCRSPASSTGWPSTELHRRLPRAPRPARGTTPSWPPWTCSTTTCGPAQVAVRPAGHRAARRPTTRSSAAMTEPPDDTRAYFRGKCLQRWADVDRRGQLGLAGVRRRQRPAAAGPDDGTARVEPRRTSIRCSTECASPAELVERLGS